MAVLNQNEEVGGTNFPFDQFNNGSLTSRTRSELLAGTTNQTLDVLSASVSGTTFTVPAGSHYIVGNLFSNARSNGNPPPENSPLSLVVEAGAICEIRVNDAGSFREGEINVQGTLVLIDDGGSSAWPSNSGNGTRVTSLIINGTLSSNGEIFHGRGLSPTAVVNFDGLTLLGQLSIQFGTNVNWINVSATPGLSDRFFRLVNLDGGTLLSQRWMAIGDGTWPILSNIFQINRGQYTNETDVLMVGDDTQFPTQTELRLGTSATAADGVNQSIRRMFAFNPQFTDSNDSSPVTDVRLNFDHADHIGVYLASVLQANRNTQFSSIPNFQSGDFVQDDAGGYFIQTGIATKNDSSQSTFATLQLAQNAAQTFFSKSYSHISADEDLPTANHKQTGLGIYSESSPFPLAADTSLNGHAIDIAQAGDLRVDEAIRPATFITDSANIYPALKFAWYGDDTNSATLPLTATGNQIQFNGRLNINAGADTSVPSGRSIIKTQSFTTDVVDHFILNSSSSTNGSLDNVTVNGDIRITKAATASAGHNLFIDGTTVTGTLFLRNENSSDLQFLNAGLADGTFGAIDVGAGVVLNLDIDVDTVVNLDVAWGTGTFAQDGVTINNSGTGMVTVSSATAGAAGVSFTGNATLLQSAVFTAPAEIGTVLEVYDINDFVDTTSNSATPLGTAGPGATVSIDLAAANNLVGIVTAPGFLTQLIAPGVIANDRAIAAPTLVPDANANITGTPVGHTLVSTATQSTGVGGTSLTITGAEAVRLTGDNTNALFSQVVLDRGFGRGLILNWLAQTLRSTDWEAPTDTLITFAASNRVNLSDRIVLLTGTAGSQLLTGVNETANSVFGTVTASLNVNQVGSVGNPMPDAGSITSNVLDGITPILEATQDAAESTEAAINENTL